MKKRINYNSCFNIIILPAYILTSSGILIAQTDNAIENVGVVFE